jgi:3-phosphoshikimate 1-carboxyvinyltransferase
VLGSGSYTLTGSPRMQQRPIQDLLEALGQLGVETACLKAGGCPPVRVRARRLRGGAVTVDCGTSSQFLSALLLIAPYSREGVEVAVSGDPVSRPYIDLTVDVMAHFGVPVERQGYRSFKVPGSRVYRAAAYRVEPDCSQAGYFWTAAAVSGGSVKVLGIGSRSRQGDFGLVQVLAHMGCTVAEESDGVGLTGGKLRGVTVDMGDMPDVVPTLAVAAAFAEGVTTVKGVAHLRVKESDRLAAVIEGLSRMGIRAEAEGDTLRVWGGEPHGAVIDPHGDHRMAMSFALAGLRIPGMAISDETCVAKSFPFFWQVLEDLVRP